VRRTTDKTQTALTLRYFISSFISLQQRQRDIKRRNEALIIPRSIVANELTNRTLPSTSLPFTAQLATSSTASLTFYRQN
jgi:hypothetical protein